MQWKYEICGNVEYISIHTDVRLVDKHLSPSFAEGEELNLLSLIQSSNGVQDVLFVKPYEIVVGRALLINPEIIAASVIARIIHWLFSQGVINSQEEILQIK